MSYNFRKFAPIVDVLLAPLVPFAAIVNLAVAHWAASLPRCTRILDRFGTYPIRHHYYSPLTYASDLRTSLRRERVINGLDLNIEGQLALLATFNYRDELLGIPREKPDEMSFGYHNKMFGPGDAEYLYNMIRRFKPLKILEIGSGQSSLIAKLAIAANRRENPTHQCEQICVEPFEQPWLERTGVTVHRTKVEDLDPSIVDQLQANDILFIDSSHVIRPQGDVLHEYLHLLGRVKLGVVIHIHDIFTPRDYPDQWVLHDRRLWNEQYLLEAFLCFNQDFKVIGAVNWLHYNHRDRLGDACPVLSMEPQSEPGSFWCMRVAKA